MLVSDLRRYRREQICTTSSVSIVLNTAFTFSFCVVQLLVDFSYGECLHGFWCTLLKFNPYMQSTEHGQNLEAQVQEFIPHGKVTRRKESTTTKDQDADSGNDQNHASSRDQNGPGSKEDAMGKDELEV